MPGNERRRFLGNRFQGMAGATGQLPPPSQNPEIPSAARRGERQARDARPREATSGERVPQ